LSFMRSRAALRQILPPNSMQSLDFPQEQKSLTAASVLCLLNGAAGSDTANARRQEVTRAFAAINQPVEIVLIQHGKPIAELARKAIARGDPLVIAGGGDGTVSAVANALVGTETALAVLPLGTLNHFAKDLGIPLEIEAAVSSACTGTVRTVDVGDVNGHVFINNSSIGLYPAIIRERETLQEGGRSKWIAFAEALLGVLKRSRAIRVRLKSAANSVNTRTEFVFIGNNVYDFAPPRIGGRNRLDEGVLWVSRLPHTGRFRAVLAALRPLVARPASNSSLAFTTTELSIQLRRRRIDVALDGEVVSMAAPLRYRIRPRALRVVVPSDT
jgi:diacylglycerol kinase family enzyme